MSYIYNWGETNYMDMLKTILTRIWYLIVSLARLLTLGVILLLNGLYQIFFNQSEVVNVTLHTIPDRATRGTLSFIESLAKNNLEVYEGNIVPPQNQFDAAPFMDDTEYIDGSEDDIDGDEGTDE